MIDLLSRRKLKFKFRPEHTATGISLAEALAGRAGIVYLGENNVSLWTPTSGKPTQPEAVCDCRFLPLQRNLFDRFGAATESLLLPAKIVVFQGTNRALIEEALTMFDYVLAPLAHIRNKPQDIISKRVLAYEKPLYTRHRYDITKGHN